MSEFETARLRRLATLCGVATPESDETLLFTAGATLGMIAQSVESLHAANTALRLRVETAEKENQLYRKNARAFGAKIWDENDAEWQKKVDEAYAKGQRDMREEASKIALLWRCLLPSTCCDNTSDATCQSISEEIKSLPIKERP